MERCLLIGRFNQYNDVDGKTLRAPGLTSTSPLFLMSAMRLNLISLEAYVLMRRCTTGHTLPIQ